MIDDRNLQAKHWTDDPEKCKEILTKVKPRIDSSVGYFTNKFGIKTYQEDIVSEINCELLQAVRDKEDTFSKFSCEEVADNLLRDGNYWIFNRARSLTRREANKQWKQDELNPDEPKQAKIFADLRTPYLPEDVKDQLLAIIASIPRVISVVPTLTPREIDIYGKEVIRRVEIDALSPEAFAEASRIADLSDSEVCEHINNHTIRGTNSVSDRKAWSRARAKIAKALTSTEFKLLLTIVLAFLLSLSYTNQDRSGHQKRYVVDSGHQKTHSVNELYSADTIAFLSGHQ